MCLFCSLKKKKPTSKVNRLYALNNLYVTPSNAISSISLLYSLNYFKSPISDIFNMWKLISVLKKKKKIDNFVTNLIDFQFEIVFINL